MTESIPVSIRSTDPSPPSPVSSLRSVLRCRYLAGLALNATVARVSRPGAAHHIQLDERSAGFFALGQAKASGRPSVLICTSGTAAANYLPAVVEANHACVPMIVCTADRPRSCAVGVPARRSTRSACTPPMSAGLPICPFRPIGRSRLPAWPPPGPSSRPWAQAEALSTSTGRFATPRTGRWRTGSRYPTPDDRLSFASAPTTDRLGELGGYEQGVILVGPDAVAGITPGYALPNMSLNSPGHWPGRHRGTDERYAAAQRRRHRLGRTPAQAPDP